VAAWLYVPLGVTCILAVCFGVHSLISLSSVSFPASVACMIGLFLILVLLQGILGDRKTKQIVSLIEIPVSVSMISVFQLVLSLLVRLCFTIYQHLLLPCIRHLTSQSFHKRCGGRENHSCLQSESLAPSLPTLADFVQSSVMSSFSLLQHIWSGVFSSLSGHPSVP
jgi:hypothetical protein